jgi:hypothetical protein
MAYLSKTDIYLILIFLFLSILGIFVYFYFYYYSKLNLDLDLFWEIDYNFPFVANDIVLDGFFNFKLCLLKFLTYSSFKLF